VEFDERKVRERGRLIAHCDYFFRPPASFYAELEQAIELAATERRHETMAFGGKIVPAAGLIEDYGLEEFVERAENPEDGVDEDLLGREAAPLRGFEPRFPD
jgi:hypothetical protein